MNVPLRYISSFYVLLYLHRYVCFRPSISPCFFSVLVHPPPLLLFLLHLQKGPRPSSLLARNNPPAPLSSTSSSRLAAPAAAAAAAAGAPPRSPRLRGGGGPRSAFAFGGHRRGVGRGVGAAAAAGAVPGPRVPGGGGGVRVASPFPDPNTPVLGLHPVLLGGGDPKQQQQHQQLLEGDGAGGFWGNSGDFLAGDPKLGDDLVNGTSLWSSIIVNAHSIHLPSGSPSPQPPPFRVFLWNHDCVATSPPLSSYTSLRSPPSRLLHPSQPHKTA